LIFIEKSEYTYKNNIKINITRTFADNTKKFSTYFPNGNIESIHYWNNNKTPPFLIKVIRKNIQGKITEINNNKKDFKYNFYTINENKNESYYFKKKDELKIRTDFDKNQKQILFKNKSFLYKNGNKLQIYFQKDKKRPFFSIKYLKKGEVNEWIQIFKNKTEPFMQYNYSKKDNFHQTFPFFKKLDKYKIPTTEIKAFNQILIEKLSTYLYNILISKEVTQNLSFWSKAKRIFVTKSMIKARLRAYAKLINKRNFIINILDYQNTLLRNFEFIINKEFNFITKKLNDNNFTKYANRNKQRHTNEVIQIIKNLFKRYESKSNKKERINKYNKITKIISNFYQKKFKERFNISEKEYIKRTGIPWPSSKENLPIFSNNLN